MPPGEQQTVAAQGQLIQGERAPPPVKSQTSNVQADDVRKRGGHSIPAARLRSPMRWRAKA
jgi:hypothetical protein